MYGVARHRMAQINKFHLNSGHRYDRSEQMSPKQNLLVLELLDTIHNSRRTCDYVKERLGCCYMAVDLFVDGHNKPSALCLSCGGTVTKSRAHTDVYARSRSSVCQFCSLQRFFYLRNYCDLLFADITQRIICGGYMLQYALSDDDKRFLRSFLCHSSK